MTPEQIRDRLLKDRQIADVDLWMKYCEGVLDFYNMFKKESEDDVEVSDEEVVVRG